MGSTPIHSRNPFNAPDRRPVAPFTVAQPARYLDRRRQLLKLPRSPGLIQTCQTSAKPRQEGLDHTSPHFAMLFCPFLGILPIYSPYLGLYIGTILLIQTYQT